MMKQNMKKLKYYPTIQAFQEDWPEREGREAFVRTLSNEEIDELIDLSCNIQGKIYYQKQKKPETVFAYTLRDAWGALACTCRVTDGPEGGAAAYFNAPEEPLRFMMMPLEEISEKVRIPWEVLRQIRRTLEDDRLFETENLECTMSVMDGWKQEFEISGHGRNIKVFGSNIQACRGNAEKYPHSVLMIRTLEKIRNLLASAGVPGECLRLSGRA